MVVSDAINNIMGGMESTAGVRLHNHRRKLRQRFDIIKKLGQGTYGKVQLGINKETGQEVAIKTIKKSKIETEADLVRIRREIQIMSSVQHPNIIHIYEVFENREKMVLVMEYAAGGELYDFLSERKVLAESEARRIFRQIATAVFYCHKHNICHRDLKLENILLDEHGAAKIADFGLSNVFDEQRLLATFCGSPLYASPEIVRGTPYRGPEVDCWSLGVLLYTLVYGAMPFDGSNFKRLVKQISNGEYFEPKKPSPASGLIRAMLCVDPATRADISAVCSDAWINEGSGHTCFELAEELAAQTPVRLDLLLSLAPAAAAPPGTEPAPAEPLARSQSVGALMELDKALAQPARRRSSAAEQEPSGKDAVTAAKRKLEEGSSTDEASSSGAKRKERTSRRRDRSVERTGERKTRSASRSKQPKPKAEEPAVAPVANEIPPESPMDVDVEAKPEEKVDLEVKEDKSGKPTSKVEATSEVAAEDAKVTDDAKKVKVKRKKKVEEDSGSKEDVSISESSQIVEKPKEVVAAKAAETVEVKTETTENAEEAKVAKSTEPEKPKAIKKTGSIKKKSEPAKPAEEEAAKPMARRRSKIFESEIQKFNNPEPKSPVVEKPKKVFIPGVKVSDFKKAYERKSSVDLSATAAVAAVVPNLKTSQSKTAVEKTESEPKEPVSAEPAAESAPAQKMPAPERIESMPVQSEPAVEKPVPADLAKLKKNAIEIIGNAIAKPPKPLDALKMKQRSPPESPRSEMNKVLESLKTPDRRQEDSSGKKVVKVQVGPNDVRNAVLQVSTPELVENFKFEERDRKPANTHQGKEEATDRPKVSTKVEITLKSATLPRRKTSKAEIQLESPPAPPKPEFRTQVQHVVQAVGPKLPTQRSEVAFPVAAAQTSHRSMSVEPESAIREKPKERIIPIQFAREPDDRPPLQSQRSNQSNQSVRSSLSRQSTLDSDGGESAPPGPEPIRKSPREFIIPIAVEGGGFVTPRAASLEPGAATPGAEPKRKPMRFARPLRMSSLLSESDDDCFSPFSPGGRHREGDSAGIDDEFGAHMHQLRSSRASRFPAERADSVSSGEDDDDDNFELLTAESLFSTLLSRVRNLTQRLNTDDGRPAFPTSRFMNHNFPSRSSFFSEPLSRRVSETSQFSRQSSRDRSCDRDSNHSSSTLRSGNSNSTIPRSGNSNASLPRAQSRTDSSSSIYTPSLSRRLLANQEPSLPRNSSHSSLPTTRATARPVSRTGSLKSAENKSRLPTSFLHRSGSESFEGNKGKARFNESPSRGYDNSRSYESPAKSTESPRPYDNLTRQYDNVTRPYDNATRQYDNYSTPYESRLPSPYECPEGEDVYGSWSSLHSGQYPRRNLAAGSTNSLPRRHTYRTSMSDSLDFTRPEEPRPPLPGRRLPRSSSYLRQRALDIANVYAAPLAADSDYADRLAEFRARRSATPVRRAGSVSRDPDGAEPAAEGLKRPTTLDLAPECSVLGKLLGDGRDEMPASPVRSPGRRVSRFLRPDFYDTAREDSAFVKVKAEEERARMNGGAGSRQLDITNFLQSNYADLERNIAEGLRAIGENGISREKLNSADKATGSIRSPVKKASREKGDVLNGMPDHPNNASKIGQKVVAPPALLAKAVDSLDDLVANSGARSDLEKCEAKESEVKRKLVTKEVANGVEKLERKASQESAASKNTAKEESNGKPAMKSEAKEESNGKPASKSAAKEESNGKPASKSAAKEESNGKPASKSAAKEESNGKPVLKSAGKEESNGKPASKSAAKEESNGKPAAKSAEPRANAVSDVDKNVAKTHVAKDLPVKNTEPPKSLVKSEKATSTEKTVEESDGKEKTKSEILSGAEKRLKEKVGKEGLIKVLEPLEKNGAKEMAVKTAGRNSPVKEAPAGVAAKRVVSVTKADVSAAKTASGSTENIQANAEANGSSPSSVATKILPSYDASVVSNKDETATKLPTKIKLKRKVKKDPESSPKEVTEETKSRAKPETTEEVKSKPKAEKTEEVKSKPKPETTNKNKFLRTLDKTIDKFEETVKRPGKIVREKSLAPAEAPSISALVKRAVSVDDCSEKSPEKSPNKIKRVIDSLKELAIAPKPTPDTENSLLKRATSVDDMTNPSQTKTNQVSSMLGRFRKLEEPKKTSLLSRFRKTQSVYGGSTSDGVLALDGEVGKRASLGPESFEGMNDASCSVIVRRNSVKKSEEKVDSDSDVSISATVKVIKVVKDQDAVVGKAKDESSNGKKLSGTSQSNVDLKSSKQGANAGSAKSSKQSEPTENRTGPKGDLPNSLQTNGSVSPSKLAFKKPTNPIKTDETNPTRNGKKIPSPVSPEIKVNVVGSHPTLDDRAREQNALKARDASEECESLDSCSVASERTSPILSRASSPRLDGPVESIEARIRRKSFYSRFNDSKKQPARKVSVPGLRNSGSSTAFDADAI